MKEYSLIFNQSNASVTLVEETKKERTFITFDTVREVLNYVEGKTISVPWSKVYAGYDAWKASLPV